MVRECVAVFGVNQEIALKIYGPRKNVLECPHHQIESSGFAAKVIVHIPSVRFQGNADLGEARGYEPVEVLIITEHHTVGPDGDA